MNAEELWETTMDPDQRVLLQVTLDDAAQADEMFSILMGEDVEQRRSLHPAQRQGRPLPRHLSSQRRARAARRDSRTTRGHLVTDDHRRRPPTRGPGGRIEPVDLQAEMQRSYIDYAMASSSAARCPTCATGSSRCTAACSTRCTTAATGPTAASPSAARVVGDVMGQYHPHGDTAIYDTLVRLAQPWALRYPLVHGQGNFGSPGNDPAAAMRYTECRMAPLAHGDGARHRRGDRRLPAQLRRPHAGADDPAGRFPNLLVNGSAGIAVGMATNIPPHNLREVADGVQWALEHPDATREELLDALHRADQGPRLPDRRADRRPPGHRGRLPHRPRLDHACARSSRSRRTPRAAPAWSITELPYQVNPDNLALKIAELADAGKVQGIADVRDDTSGRTGQRLVIVLKRDAVAKVVLNNLYKHTQLQTNFGANMLALVDGVPRTLTHRPVHHATGSTHQIEVIQRRTALPAAQGRGARPHPARPGQGARRARRGHRADPRARPTSTRPAPGLMELLEIDEIQASAILDMQLRRLAALERQKIIDELAELEARDRRPRRHPRQRAAAAARSSARSSPRSSRSTATTGAPRSSPADGDMSMEDLIPEEDVVVTITRGGYAKRTRADHYRSQKRGGKGVRGAALRGDDVVEHFFATTTHHWLLFFTNSRPGLPRQGLRAARGRRATPRASTSPTCWRSSPTSRSPRCWRSATTSRRPTSCSPPAAAWSRRPGSATTTRPRQAGVIAINLRDDDELIGAELVDGRRRPAAGLAQGPVGPVHAPTTTRCGRWAGPPPASPA